MKESIEKACKVGDLPLLKRLLNQSNKDERLSIDTPLGLCCRHGHISCVRWLIEELNTSIGNALGSACCEGSLACVEYLLQHGANINYTGEDGTLMSPLERASSHPVTVKCILSYKPGVFSALRSSTLLNLLNCGGYDGYKESVLLIMQSGTRLPTSQYMEVDKAIRVNRAIQYYDLKNYESLLDDKHRQCVRAAVMLTLVLKERGVPRDLRKQICNTLVLPTWLDDEWGNKFKIKNVVL